MSDDIDKFLEAVALQPPVMMAPKPADWEILITKAVVELCLIVKGLSEVVGRMDNEVH